MSLNTLVKPIKKPKYRDITLDEDRISNQNTLQKVVSNGHTNFLGKVPEALPAFITQIAIQHHEVQKSDEIAPKRSTELAVFNPIDLGHYAYETIPLTDDMVPLSTDTLAASFVELFQAMPMNLSYPLRIQIQIMPSMTVPLSSEENISLEINIQIASVADADKISISSKPYCEANNLDGFKLDTLQHEPPCQMTA
ncbi:MAG: hypothetical protein U1E78_10080 [Gammaproteobacteria bacterium]